MKPSETRQDIFSHTHARDALEGHSHRPPLATLAGAFESNPEAYGVLERLQEVSGLDRYWRTFTDTLLALGEDKPDAYSPGR